MPKTKHFPGFYLGLQFFFGALTLMVGIMSAISNQPYITWLAWLPNCAFLIYLTEQVRSEQAGLVQAMAILSTAISFVILLLISLPPLRDIRNSLGKDFDSHGRH
jgi:cyanate permease